MASDKSNPLLPPASSRGSEEERPQEKRKRAIANVERAIDLIMKQLNRKDLSAAELKQWAFILSHLSGVLNNLLKEAEKEPGAEESEDLVSLLDKIPKQFIKPAKEDDDLVELAWRALKEAIRISNRVLRNLMDYTLEEQRQWAAILPGLLSALLVLSNVAEGPSSPAIVREEDLI